MNKARLRRYCMLPRWRIRVTEEYEEGIEWRTYWEWCDLTGKSSDGSSVQNGQWILFRDAYRGGQMLERKDWSFQEDEKAWSKLLNWAKGYGYDEDNDALPSCALYRFAEDLRIFNSYSSQDEEVVRNIVGKLRKNGICTFLAVEDFNQQLVAELDFQRRNPFLVMEKGLWAEDHLYLALQDAIEESGILILWLSKNSISSPWVKRELEWAAWYSIPMLVIRLDDTPVPDLSGFTDSLDIQQGQELPKEIISLCLRLWNEQSERARRVVSAELLKSNEYALREQITNRLRVPSNEYLVFVNRRINRLLSARYEMCLLFGHSPSKKRFQIDGNSVSAYNVLVGNLIVARGILIDRTTIWPKHCTTCCGILNLSDVYPGLYKQLSKKGRENLLLAALCKCQNMTKHISNSKSKNMPTLKVFYHDIADDLDDLLRLDRTDSKRRRNRWTWTLP